MTRHLTLPVGPRDHAIGSPHAPVTLVEYGDYECPYCGQAHRIIQELLVRFGDSLRFVFRNFPLTELHRDAFRAAETAEWAALSRRFWPMHDHLLENQERLGPTDLLLAATQLELDRHQLQTAWHDHALRARIAEDVRSGMDSGVTGTPTFFINGRRHEGPWDLVALSQALAEAGGRER